MIPRLSGSESNRRGGVGHRLGSAFWVMLLLLLPATAGAQIDLQLEMSVNDPEPDVGGNVVFTLTVINVHASNDASGVAVTDQLPSGYVYQSADGDGTYNGGTGVWTVDDVNAGASRTLKITAQVKKSGDYTNLILAPVTTRDTPRSKTGAGRRRKDTAGLLVRYRSARPKLRPVGWSNVRVYRKEATEHEIKAKCLRSFRAPSESEFRTLRFATEPSEGAQKCHSI